MEERPVYKKRGKKEFLFYSPGGNWMVGPDTSDAGELRTAERLMERALQLQQHPRMVEILHELQARLKATEAGGGEL